MKSAILTLFALLLVANVEAQQKKFLSKEEDFCKADKARSYVLIEKEKGKGIKVESYTLGGTLRNVSYFSKYGKDRADRIREGRSVTKYANGKDSLVCFYVDNRREGEAKSFYPSGQIKMDFHFGKNILNDSLKVYYPNGNIRRKEVYKDNQCVSGKLWDKDGNELEFFPHYSLPQFPGGLENYQRVVKELLKYPEGLRKQGVQGRVTLRFVIDKDGQMIDIMVADTDDFKLNEPAIKTMKAIGAMYYWIPGKVEGKPVKTSFASPISFRL
ncbi:MAG: TonB family protein [Mediterranea sp.]|jgi:protein TonB|nr:TonB family protein [Mediterranea sp.]